MSDYKSEFGASFNLGFELSLYPWLIDKSWHNDECPSFIIPSKQAYFVLWVDFKNIEDRESEQVRYVVMTAINEGTIDEPEIYHNSESQVVFSSECSAELVSFLNTIELAN